MTSPEWKTRRDSFYELIWLGDATADHESSRFAHAVEMLCARFPTDADAIHLSLIELLDRENDVVNEHARLGSKFGEDYSDYYGDLIGAVSGLNDSRAVTALLGAVDTGGMAQRALAEFGPSVLPRVIEVVRDTRAAGTRRAGALWVLHDMLMPPYAGKVNQPSVRAEIDRALLAAAQDPDFAVRLAAVTALADAGDRDAIPVLERLAAHDPVRLRGEAEDGRDLYPVRLAAQRALSRLKHTP